jgi:hypothetical protein
MIKLANLLKEVIIKDPHDPLEQALIQLSRGTLPKYNPNNPSKIGLGLVDSSSNDSPQSNENPINVDLIIPLIDEHSFYIITVIADITYSYESGEGGYWGSSVDNSRAPEPDEVTNIEATILKEGSFSNNNYVVIAVGDKDTDEFYEDRVIPLLKLGGKNFIATFENTLVNHFDTDSGEINF